ncbi:MAG: serine hydrolase domain-containing protein [Pseudomonadota bacterium]
MGRFLAIMALCCAFTVQASTSTDTIDDILAEGMERSGVPGVAYAEVSGGAITQGKSGVKTIGSEDAITTETPFLIGSVSKSFTALAIMQLVEAGALGLDDPVSQYLAEFNGQPAGAITIRQLLSHTSGFSMYQGNEGQADLAQDTDALARRVEALAAAAPVHQPGTVWEYSNANYQILGRLIETASGQPFGAYMTENVLIPAGMTNSYVFDGERRPQTATGHRPFFFGKTPNSESLTGRGSGPQGGIVATAQDMARYLAMMMNEEDDLLSAAGKAMMMQPANEASPEYGFGWFLDPARGLVFHSGANPGFEALATMRPADQMAVVVLTNAGSGAFSGETTGLRNSITAHFLDLDYAGEASSCGMIAGLAVLALLPVIYLLSMVWAWRKRADLRAKSGVFGLFSLWFPVLATVTAAWVIFSVVPRLFGAPFSAIRLFQPDTGLVLAATAVLGVVWALFRLGVAYTGRSA